MLKNKFKIIAILITIITLISAFCVVKATDDTAVTTSEDADITSEVSEDTEDDIYVDETTTEEDYDILYEDLYIFDNSVTMDKIVDGNVYIFGSDVKITGKVNGDLFVFGNEVTFTSPYDEEDTEHQDENYCYIAGSVYACASTFSFDAIAQDIYVACEDFYMSYNSYIMRDVHVISSDVLLKGYITRDVNIYAQNIDFGTQSDNDEEDDAALIYGNLNYYSDSELSIPDGIVIGEITFNSTKSSTDTDSDNNVVAYLIDLLDSIIYTLVIYLILAWLMPKFFAKTANTLKTSSLPSFGIGILALIVVPLIAVILLSLSFVSLSVTLIAVYAILLAISFTIVAGALTDLLKDKLGFSNKKLLLLIIVTIILWALQQIPFVQLIITFIILILGLGLVIKNIIDRNKDVEVKE